MTVKDVGPELELGRGKAPGSAQHSNDEQYLAAVCAGARALYASTPTADGAAALRSAEAALAKARQARSRTLFEVNPRRLASDPTSFTTALARNAAVFNLRGKV